MKKALIIIFLIITIPCFSLIRKEENEAGKDNILKLKKVVGLIEQLKTDKLLGQDSQNEWRNIVYTINNGKQNVNSIKSMFLDSKTKLIKSMNLYRDECSKNMLEITKLSSELNSRINSLNERLLRLNNEKSKKRFSIIKKDFSKLTGIVAITKNLSYGNNHTEIVKTDVHSILNNENERKINKTSITSKVIKVNRNKVLNFNSKVNYRDYLIKRVNELNSLKEKVQLGNIDIQNSLQRMQQTIQMLSSISKLMHDTNPGTIKNLK